jgi:hypothetical protein
VDSVASDDDTALMVMVPNSSPIANNVVSLVTVLNDTQALLQQLQNLPAPPPWSPGLLGTLGTLIGLINSYTPVGDRYPLPIVRADVVKDPSNISFSPGLGDNFDDSDESVLFIGIQGYKLSLNGGDRMDLITGPEMFVIVEDLGNPTSFQPSGGGASVSDAPGIKDSLERIEFYLP